MKKVLVIDDEEDFCFLTKKDLEATGHFEVSVCNHAAEAIQETKRIHPDVILLDIMMPEISGTEIAAKFKKDVATRDIPVIFLTALLSGEDTEEKRKVFEPWYAISKAIKIDELVTLINQVTF